MRALLQHRLPVVCFAFLLAVAFAPYRLLADHAWGEFHWERAANPVSIGIGDNVSDNWAAHLQKAVVDWNGSSALALDIRAGFVDPQLCPAQAGRVEVCNFSYGLTGWLGIAKIGTDGAHIVQALAAVNDTYFYDFAWLYGFDSWEWRQSVMCQEIGHAFGLNHQDEIFDNPNLGSCMDYTNDPAGLDPFYGPPNVEPNAHDYQQLEDIYLHLDGGDGGSGGGTGGNGRGNGGGGGGGGNGGGRGKKADIGFAPDLPDQATDHLAIDHPSQWGRLIRSAGRVSLFERDLGAGRRVFTFVTWAD